MPVYQLIDDCIFPPVELASCEGLLAVGGDLSCERLILAYRQSIFPWYSEGEPILWWSPDPRFVLFPEKVRISRSMKQILRQGVFTVTFDRKFQDVIEGCRQPRKGQKGTWITDEMLSAYLKLHRIGLAHCVEAWHGGKLAGGLYGVSLGGCFFGESMFTRISNASKAAFISLTLMLKLFGFTLIDCQIYSDHLKSLGAEMISRRRYLDILQAALKQKTWQGSWHHWEEMLPKVIDSNARNL